MNGGDQLAKGAKSAQFPASEGKISQERWDAAFADYIPGKTHETKDNLPAIVESS